MDLTVQISDQDHIQGPAGAPLTLIEYGDYQCPDAGHMHPIIQDLIEEFSGKIRLVYRQFPLPIHPKAIPAAEAAEAAGAQGKFFEMTHLLYKHQHRLTETQFEHFAGLLSLDKQRFASDLQSHRYLERIIQQEREGRALGVYATPTIFLNGEMYDGEREADELRSAITEKLQSVA